MAPDKFRHQKRNWFMCPYCGFRSWSSYSYVDVEKSVEMSSIQNLFWCERCEKTSVLANGPNLAFIALGSSALLFIALYQLLIAVGAHWSFWEFLAWFVLLGVFSAYVLAPLSSRLLNRYVQKTGNGL
jgi:hypothetical protein